MDGDANSQRGAETNGADLHLPGMALLRGRHGNGGPTGDHLSATWVLEDPETIRTEQEMYVERYLAPTQADVELTPLRVISSYYNTQGSRSLHRMAAETEKAMNDDGYATYIQRSSTFYDVSHAARRGYGQEGSIFVAVPFTLTDITPQMVGIIRRRASAVPTSSKTQKPTSSNSPLKERDNSVTDDGFHELRLTAARCAMTVESLFRQAHRGVAVTVGTLDVVTASGISSAVDLDFSKPSDVLFPLKPEDRASLGARRRRYTRITCEPPDFASGWDDASYGFRWKDNLRRRRVVVPLTQLEGLSATPTDPLRGEDAAATLERRFPLQYMGRYATLQLYRGESYVFFLRTGALVLPNWDLMLRLLYLRTPARDRAVLSSRPTPRVAWIALAASVAKMWDTEPFLRLSLTASWHRNGKGATDRDGEGAATAPPPDQVGQRLLAALPADVASWLSAAREEAELVLWLVTPSWLWPTMAETLADWRQLTASSDAQPPPGATASTLRLLFASDAVNGVLGDAASTLMTADLDTVQTTPVKRSDAAAASLHGQRVVSLRGGTNPTTNSTPQAVVAASLTPSEVYELLFLAEKRPPTPEQPIVQVPSSEPTLHRVPSQDLGPSVEPLCGEATSEAPYYSAADKALLKRSFEYCWLKEHRKVLRQQLHRLLHSTKATTVLKTTQATKVPAAGARGAKGGREGGPVVAEVAPRSSVCLADMRYLAPMEATLLTGADEGTSDSGPSAHHEEHAADQPSLRQENAWLTSAANVGKVHGVATSLVSKAARGTKERQGGSPQSPKDAASTPPEPTPYVLQSAASLDLLFGPAEAFFEFDTAHRLRTRARSLSEQLEERRLRREGLTATAAHAQVPEAVELDTSLQFMDGDLEDVYVTQALWTRGWNIFGTTEPVAVGTGEEEFSRSASAATTAPTSSSVAEDSVPAELRDARTFTHDKFWALLMAHRDAGTPLGATETRQQASAPRESSLLLYPLRRTMKEWELFAGMPLTTLRDALHPT
ncbi:hypothetical protein, conserved [Leishmania tarentolae]|uniref:Uncharacterized protein n=1 Tax=Leishmania tarentolae TaxID=5689 RepID=A0A640KCH5_LEITA|nr:hypothetical protein, conserved [Leishmania tarentolae]